MTPFGKEVLYNPKITKMVPSYDGRNKEPVTFPAKIPIVLAQGTEGIAVGMSTKILPHNLTELLKAQIKYLKNRKFEILPDFPTGGMVDASEYQDGMGKVTIRAKFDTSDPKVLLIKEIPFGTTTESLIDSIESATKKGKIKISSIQDFTAEHVEIEIRLMRGVRSEEIVDALYAFTDCELSISSNIILIKEDKPCQMLASEVLIHNTEQLVLVLEAELKIEASDLRDKLHAKTLEQIFIENRVYKKIEDKKSSQEVHEAVIKGMKAFHDQIKREVTDEDVETLLRIPIRRISLYDINKAKKEMTEIRRRLREIKEALSDIRGYAVGYIEGLLEQIKGQYKRKSEITSISKVDVREAARRDLKLRYDKATGYLGYKSNGDPILDVSQYDRVLVIKRDATYSVIDVPEKLFIDKQMLYCNFHDKDLVYNIVYREKKSQLAYIKRCKIEKFILERVYELIPEGAVVLDFTLGEENFSIDLEYKPKAKARVKNQSFSLLDFPIRGLKAGGLKLSNREVKKGSFKKNKKS
jgi:topoisomerase-4 subunit A